MSFSMLKWNYIFFFKNPHLRVITRCGASYYPVFGPEASWPSQLPFLQRTLGPAPSPPQILKQSLLLLRV